MSLFGSLFGKKKPALFTCKVMSARPNLDQFLVNGILRDEITLIVFFEESARRIKALLPESHTSRVITAEKVSGGFALPQIRTFLNSPGRSIAFGERYPLHANEIKTAERLSQEGFTFPFTIYSSLDDAFFRAFGGDRIQELMKRLGLDENEFIEHSMIEKSIENAQKKLAEKVSVESHARSEQEWFKMNIPDAS